MPALTLRVLPGIYAVSRLAPDAPVPVWAATVAGFTSLTRTTDELSIVCAECAVPAEIRAERGWALIQLVGPFPFTATGILAYVAQPLAAANIGILALGTFDTDYILVKQADLPRALTTLRAASHTIV